jgi:hypothetical protein
VTVNPVPGYEGPSVDAKGRSSESDFRFKKSLSRFTKALGDLGLPDSLTIGQVNADELYDDGNRVLTEAGRQTTAGGFDATPHDHGTKSSGTLTIDPLDGQHQIVIGNGGFTLSPGSTTKHTTVILHLTNGSSAGTVTFTGFTKKYPSGSLDTTNAHKFAIILFFYGSDGCDYSIQPRQ